MVKRRRSGRVRQRETDVGTKLEAALSVNGQRLFVDDGPSKGILGVAAQPPPLARMMCSCVNYTKASPTRKGSACRSPELPSGWQSYLRMTEEEGGRGELSLDLYPHSPTTTPLSSDLLPAFNSPLAILYLRSLALDNSPRLQPLALSALPTPGHSSEESLSVRRPPSSPSGLLEQTYLPSK